MLRHIGVNGTGHFRVIPRISDEGPCGGRGKDHLAAKLVAVFRFYLPKYLLRTAHHRKRDREGIERDRFGAVGRLRQKIDDPADVSLVTTGEAPMSRATTSTYSTSSE